MTGVATRHLFSLRLPPGGMHPVGKIATGERRVGLVSPQGTFTGERLRGVVLPGGSDWLLIRPEGTVTMDTRIVLETDDKALIAFAYQGLRHGPPEIMAKLARGEPVDPSEYYMRIVGTFETAAPQYEWLNRTLCVGTGTRPPEAALYDVFEVL